TEAVEPFVFDLLRRKAIGLGASVLALNGMPDHCHLVVTVPPSIALSDFIGQVKGVASAKFNQARLRDLPLYWQDEYGVLSFDRPVLANFVDYVTTQKQHHAQSQLLTVLERTDDNGVRTMREPTPNYPVADNEWWQAMTLYD